MEVKKQSLVKEFVYFVKHEKKWWMGFLMFVLILLSAFIYLTETSAVLPFIYPFL